MNVHSTTLLAHIPYLWPAFRGPAAKYHQKPSRETALCLNHNVSLSPQPTIHSHTTWPPLHPPATAPPTRARSWTSAGACAGKPTRRHPLRPAPSSWPGSRRRPLTSLTTSTTTTTASSGTSTWTPATAASAAASPRTTLTTTPGRSSTSPATSTTRSATSWASCSWRPWCCSCCGSPASSLGCGSWVAWACWRGGRRCDAPSLGCRSSRRPSTVETAYTVRSGGRVSCTT
ncbi:hypothetical protein F4780DRAFT_446577 [Xylariomycetidae sp. FL0641]|nr:hypothetical protein F4780DRAFT_446577 [Xylariomycetidae sp. FL0641]